MTRILVDPQELHSTGQELQRVAAQLREVFGRASNAYHALEWDTSVEQSVDEQVHEVYRASEALVNRMEMLAAYLVQKGEAFTEADETGVQAFDRILLRDGFLDRVADWPGGVLPVLPGLVVPWVGGIDWLRRRFPELFSNVVTPPPAAEVEVPGVKQPGPLRIDAEALRAARTVEQKMALLRPAFEASQEATAVPWQIKAAQWALETGWGVATPKDVNTGVESFNIYGIKWTGSGKYVESWTKEAVNGQTINVLAKFRAYDSFEESIADHSRLLTSLDRYQPARACGQDFRCWCEQLQAAGYATDPEYARKLWSIITSNGWNQ